MRAFTDCHVHFRQDRMAGMVIPYSARCCERVVAMPNTDPPIHSAEEVRAWHAMYQQLAGRCCDVRMTAKLLPRTTPQDVREVAATGLAVGYKLYPAGATTNSDDGIPAEWIDSPPDRLMGVVQAISDCGLALLHHGEHPHEFCMLREDRYLLFMELLYRSFPKLRMTLEHATTEAGVAFAEARADRVLATITPHHLLLTLDDVVGDRIKPDHFCKPIAKRPRDRAALRRAAGTHAALGSDSAPHPQESKYWDRGCAGIFNAPVLAEVVRMLELPESFTRLNAARFYGLPETTGRQLEFSEGPWCPGRKCGDVTPFMWDRPMPHGQVWSILYRNHEGRIGPRRIVPLHIWWGQNQYHSPNQWLLTAHDLDKRATRTFATANVIEWLHMR